MKHFSNHYITLARKLLKLKLAIISIDSLQQRAEYGVWVLISMARALGLVKVETIVV